MALFRVDYSGRGELSERQQKVETFYALMLSLIVSCSLLRCVFKEIY